MYVRCSIDVENPNEPRDFISGRIVEINDFSEVAKVEFFDLLNLRKYYNVPQTLEFPLSKLNHCILRNGSLAEYNGNMYHIIQHNIDKSNNFIYYYLTSDTSTVLKICEKDIKTTFNSSDVSPLSQLKRFEFQNPMWYFGRSAVNNAIHTIDNAFYGFKELAGCKIFLKPYQLKTVMRCLSEPSCRYMIADEVGLGKTIEAASVLKVYLSDKKNKKVLVCVPDALVEQWKTELAFKFSLFNGDNLSGNNIKITPMSQITMTNNKYDFIIIDEASMISVDVLSLLFKYIDIYKTKILFIGDENQLPAIGTGDTIRDLRQMNVYEEHLNINYRSSMAINTNATSLLNGDNTIKTDDTFEFIDIEKDIDNKENVMEIISKEVINSDNDTIVLSPYRKKEIKGNIVELNNTIHKNIFGDIRKDFFNGWCIGDKVILVKTNYKRKYFNGDTGIITGYKRNAVTVNKEKQDAYIVTLSNGNNVYVVDENDIELAYSITIHKAQGSEYDEVNIYIPQYSPFISKELLYTAITRAKNKVRLWTTKEIYDLVCKTESVRRNTLIGLWNKDNLSQVI